MGHFNLIINELHEIRSKVIDVRYNEAKKLFEANKHSIKISSFELMEYKFHENSHTNILQYLFDFRYLGNVGVKILKSFLEKIDTEESKKIASLVGYCTYRTEREKSISNGRMDLLIEDNTQKFVVMIENKILSSVIEKESEENEEEETITRTQLTNYKEYIRKEYPKHIVLLVLLSFKQQELINDDFVFADYKMVNEVLNEVDEEDNILSEYKILLNSLLSNKIDKVAALELGYQLFNDQQKSKPSLYELEMIKSTFYA
ncbi:MAG: PD-(D/E)XK nuclease family protein [Chitinophagaceae bacterium]|nr:PD-(D/E)XK nuclease family protein [Chitinophagaceae bacterium]